MRQFCFYKLGIFFLCSILVLQSLGCCNKKKPPKTVKVEEKTEKNEEEEQPKDLSVPDEASKILDKTGLSYSIDRKPTPIANSYNFYSDFERKYLDGIKYLEAGEENLAKAKSIFEDILNEYPNGEEASIATLCLAEIYFRSNNNEAALKLYREIVQKYPGTQAAQNAAEGIKYLENFEKHEKNFIPPDEEDKRRRRR